MKKNIFFVTLLVLLSMVSSYGQNYVGERTITTAGNVDLTSWVVPTGQSAPNNLLKIIMEFVDPKLVNGGVNAWSAPESRQVPVGHPNAGSNAQWIPCSLPGLYSINGGSDGHIVYTVSYISDPWIGVDQAATTSSPHLSSFEGTVTAEEFVSLKLSSVFADENYSKVLWRYENENIILVSPGTIDMSITNTGTYILQTRSGSSCPLERDTFNVVITGNSSIKNIEASKILKIYPNPASEYLIVSGSAAALGGEVRVYNIHGQLQRVEKLGESPLRLDISVLPAGVYFLQVGEFRGKFVKQ